MRAVFLILFLLCAQARADLKLGGQTLIFSAKYHFDSDDYAHIGYYQFSDDGTARVWSRIFRGAAKRAPVQLKRFHGPRRPQSDRTRREGGPISLVHHFEELNTDQRFPWTYENGVLTIRMNEIVHRWRRQPGDHFIVENEFEQGFFGTKGYAMLSDDPSAPRALRIEDFPEGTFAGPHWHNNLGRASRNWHFLRSELSPRRDFARAPSRNTYSHAGWRCGRTICQDSLLFNSSSASRQLIYADGGPDRNRNGWLDDPDTSSRLYFVARREDRVTGMVWIEYSYRGKQRYPLLSAGALAPAGSPLAARIDVQAKVKGNRVQVRWAPSVPQKDAKAVRLELWRHGRYERTLFQARSPQTALPAVGRWAGNIGPRPGHSYSVRVVLARGTELIHAGQAILAD